MGKVSKKSAALSQSAIAARFRRLRADNGASQADFAKLVGTDQKEISLVENGKFPSTRLLDGVISKLGIDAHWLLTGEGPMLRGESGVATLRTDEAAEPPNRLHAGRAGSATLRTEVADSELGYGAAAPAWIVKELRETVERIERQLQKLPAHFRDETTPPVLAVVEAETLSPDQLRDIRAESEQIAVLPILEAAVAAGAPRNVWTVAVEGYAFCYSRFVPHPRSTSCLHVKGDSMEPDIPEDSLVGVDHSLTDPREMRVRHGARCRALIRVEDVPGHVGCTLRNIRLVPPHLVAYPSNPTETNREYIFDLTQQENPIAGQVIWRWVSDLP